MVPMLILDKDLALERMVSVANRPDVPEPFRRSEPVIEAIFVAPADGAPARRLARTLVLAGHHASPDAPAAMPPLDDTAIFPGNAAPYASQAGGSAGTLPLAPPRDAPVAPPMETANGTGLIDRIGQLLRAARRPSMAAATPRQAFLHRESVRIRGWQVRPVDFR
jgi:hypothetical protein